MKNDGFPAAQASGRYLGLQLLFLLLVGWAAVSGGSPGTALAQEDSCVWCHQNPGFRVTNKKLFDYYRQWGLSIHAQEGVTCVECHGGNPKSRDKAKAHGAKQIGAAAATSPVNYRNIPKTCAQCHEEYYNYYRRSDHFKHLADEDQKQGPNCVTCHASVSTTVLNVNTVRATCEQCHNRKTKNHPEVPDRAEALLADFLSIHRFLRYLTIKGALVGDRNALRKIEMETDQLFAEWHTFDLKSIKKRTGELLGLLKEKRNEIQKQFRKGQ